MTEWTPTEMDLCYTSKTLSLIKVGGAWITSYAVYRKYDEKTIILEDINWEYPNTRENLERTKKAIESIGYEFKGEW